MDDDGGVGDEFVLDEGIEDNPFEGDSLLPKPKLPMQVPKHEIEEKPKEIIKQRTDNLEDDFVIDEDKKQPEKSSISVQNSQKNSKVASNVPSQAQSPAPEVDEFDDDFISDENEQEEKVVKPTIIKPKLEEKLPPVCIKQPKSTKTKIPVKISNPIPKLSSPVSKKEEFQDDFEDFEDEGQQTKEEEINKNKIPEPQILEEKPVELPQIEPKIEESPVEKQEIPEKPKDEAEIQNHENFEIENHQNEPSFFLTETNATAYHSPPPQDQDFSDDFEDFEAQRAPDTPKEEPKEVHLSLIHI